ncbi:MAG: hypothetical protein ABIH18_00015 [Candidatus Omnitrophota bacterium]
MFKRIGIVIFYIFILSKFCSSPILAEDQPQDIIQESPLKSNSIKISQEKIQLQDLKLQTVNVSQQKIIPINQTAPKQDSATVSKKVCIARDSAKDDFAILSQKVSIKKAKSFNEAVSKGWKNQSVSKAESADKLIKPLKSTKLQDLEAKRKKQKDSFSQSLDTRTARKAVLDPAGDKKRRDSSGFVVMDSTETDSRILTVPAYLVFQARQGQTEPLIQTFKISNSGAGTLNYALAKGADWFTISSSGGSVTGGEDIITVTANPSGLSEADSPYIEDITITNTSVPADSKKVRVRLSLFNQEVYSQTYTYDSNSNLIRRITPDNKVIEYKYDKLNRLNNIYYPDGKDTSYEYDANGNLIKMIDWQGTTFYAYDELNRLRAVQFPEIKPIYYDYDKAGKPIKTIYPNDDEVTYGYNKDNQLTSVTDKTGITTYEYDPTKKTNNLVKKILPNGVWTEYVYDTAKRITDVRNKKSDSSNISSYHYDYDANNNRTLVEEITHEAAKTTNYTYDKLNRLTRADYSDGTFEAYTYDASGNRLTKTTQDGDIDYEYDSDNRLIKDTNTIYFYDKSGNLIKKVTSDKTFTYEYDYNNKLIRYNDGMNLVEFGYDGNGNRVRKKVNGKITRYVNDINRQIVQVLLETDENWYVNKKYIYGLDLISQEEM